MRSPVLARRSAVTLLMCALLPVVAVAQDPRASAVARAARDWLAVVDKGDTKAAHAAAGAKFRNAMPTDAWSAALVKQRSSRGKLVQRALVQTTFDPKLEGAAPGEYVLLLYRASFEKQSDATESLTLEREKDGAWRVVGYFIR
jgi:hypothetical protein